MTITAVPMFARDAEREFSGVDTASDRVDDHGSFLDNLDQIFSNQQHSRSSISEPVALTQHSGPPTILEQYKTAGEIFTDFSRLETAEAASVEREIQPQITEIQNLVPRFGNPVATPDTKPEDPVGGPKTDLDNTDATVPETDENRAAGEDADTGEPFNDVNLVDVLPIILAVAPVIRIATPAQQIEGEGEMMEKGETARAAPGAPINLQNVRQFTEKQKKEGDDLSAKDTDPDVSNSDTAQSSDAESFSDVLTKAADSSPAKYAIDDLRKHMNALPEPNQPLSTSGRTTSLDNLPLEIGMRLLDGAREINILLSPESLGEISITLDIAQDSSISARFTADNPATLALLVQDSAALKKSLDQTGLSTGNATLQFSLSRDGQQNGSQSEHRSHSQQHHMARNDAPYPSPINDMPDIPMKSYSLQRLDRTI